MRPRTVTQRFRPLLRVNEWAALEVERDIVVRRQALREIEARLASVEQELGGWHQRMQASLGETAAFARGGYAFAAEQVAGWMQAARELARRRAQEQACLQELGTRLADLKRKRSVIERRRDDAVRQHEARLVSRLAGEHDDLWLHRRAG